MTGVWLSTAIWYRKDRRGRKVGDVALCIRKYIECEELSLKNSRDWVESLWVRIRDRGNKENLVVGVYYRPYLLMKPSYSRDKSYRARSLSSFWGT